MRLTHIARKAGVIAVVIASVFGSGGVVKSASAAEGQEITASFVKVDGVSKGRVLWIRSGPGTHFRRIGLLRYNARHVRNHGCKQVPRGYWCEITFRGVRGWSSGKFLANDRSRRT